MLKGVWGINIAVHDLNEAVTKYEIMLGVKPKVISSDPNGFSFPKIRSARFVLQGFNIILMTSTDSNDPMGKFLKDRGEGIILVSLESDDMDNDLIRIKQEGLKFIWDKNTKGVNGKVNFIAAKNMNGVQWEILQPIPDLD